MLPHRSYIRLKNYPGLLYNMQPCHWYLFNTSSCTICKQCNETKDHVYRAIVFPSSTPVKTIIFNCAFNSNDVSSLDISTLVPMPPPSISFVVGYAMYQCSTANISYINGFGMYGMCIRLIEILLVHEYAMIVSFSTFDMLRWWS